MNLTIDAGNSSVKAVIFDGDKILRIYTFKKFSLKELKSIFSRNEIRHTILSSVVRNEKPVLNFLRKNSFFIQLNSSSRVPLKNKYKTKATLGTDRLASAVGASRLFPRKNVLVIDAGTCIKYDFVNSKKEYLGGSISPGLQMRFDALYNFTARLPLIQPGTFQELTGTTTKESILTGVQNGIVHEMNGFISDYKKRYSSVKVVMSGGDAPLFAEHIKSSIFAAPNLIHVGLHEILQFNASRH